MTNTNQHTLHSFFHRAKIVLLLVMFACICSHARAQKLQSTSLYLYDRSQIPVQQADISNRTSTTQHQSYKSTIYKPFSNSSPTSQGSSNGGSDDGMRGRQNSFIKPNDPGPKSPVGEPWILLAFAAMAASVVYLRQRKTKEADRIWPVTGSWRVLDGFIVTHR
jgi:hypothetical protein